MRGYGILVAAYAIAISIAVAAVAERRPAVVVAMEEQRDCDIRVNRLDARRFEVEKRVAKLRGALENMRATMRRRHSRDYPIGIEMTEDPAYAELYSTATSALAADDPR